MAIRANIPVRPAGVPSGEDRLRLSTEVAMFLARRLKDAGIDVHVVSQEEARKVFAAASAGEGSGEEFSVADIQRLNYMWNGEEVSMGAFARAFSGSIKNRDRSLQDAERIAGEYLENVRKHPEDYVPLLRAENMSHCRYFLLRDGSVWTPSHPMADSPEYETQRGLWQIYSRVLGEEHMRDFISLLDPSKLRSEDENVRFVSMEREVSSSFLMQHSLEMNAERVNAERVKAVRNLVQYFDDNPDYTLSEKALIVKGAMTWGVCEKKNGNDSSKVKLVKLTDANDIAVPVVGGEAASIVEGLRMGLNFRDALQQAREKNLDNGVRSVPRNFTGWKIYPKSSREEDAIVLNKDAAGTGWCTGSGLSTARSHLSGGDFHIYFESGEPLIAIRTEDGKMAEPPRGAHEGQFCTEREEQIAFDYISSGHGIVAGDDYVQDIEDIRRIMSPEATWKDAFVMPFGRRYKNGEFGGDTSSWGETVNNRISSLLSSVSDEERKKEGYFYVDELKNSSSLKGVRFISRKRDFEDWNFTFIVEKGTTFHADSLQSLYVGLHVEEGATLQADFLQSVEGDLWVAKGATLQAGSLRSIGGDLTVREEATLQVDSLQSIKHDLVILEGATLQAGSLQSVKHDLMVKEGATLQADSLQSVGDNLVVGKEATLQAGSLQSIKGDLTVKEEATLQSDTLQSVGIDLFVGKGASLQADSLQSIGGDLVVGNGATLLAGSLESVGSDLYVAKDAILQVDSLQSVRFDLDVKEGATLQAGSLHSVGSDLKVEEGAALQVDSLQSVGGNLYVTEGATLQASSMQSVGIDLSLCEYATLQAGSLQSIGGNLYVLEGATLQADSLQSVGVDLEVGEGVTLHVDSLQSFGGKPYISEFSYADGSVYGFAVGKSIYLTPEGINPETPIHEYTHLWAKALEVARPDAWRAVVDSLKASSEWKSVVQDPSYPNLYDDSRIASEVLARLTAKSGGRMLDAISEEALSSGKDSVQAAADLFRKEIYGKLIPDVFGTPPLSTPETISLMVLNDFCEGRRNFLVDSLKPPVSKKKVNSCDFGFKL